MALINWDNSLSVKIAEIDAQHKRLVSMINDMHAAMKERKGNDVIERILLDMMKYTQTHFKTEEKYFDQFNYPETLAHKKEHVEFVEKVTDFQQKFHAGKMSLTIEVMNFLSNWLRNHIKGSDQKYSAFLNSKGLK